MNLKLLSLTVPAKPYIFEGVHNSVLSIPFTQVERKSGRERITRNRKNILQTHTHTIF